MHEKIRNTFIHDNKKAVVTEIHNLGIERLLS